MLILSPSFKIGTNFNTNLDSEKDKPDVKSKKEEKIKTEPNIKSNKEHKQDVKIKRTKPKIEPNKEHKQDIKMMKTEPDMNKITYEEKGSFGVGNNIYLYSIVDVQMTYRKHKPRTSLGFQTLNKATRFTFHKCVVFIKWYHSFGSVTMLNILKDPKKVGHISIVWKTIFDQRKDWHYLSILFYSAHKHNLSFHYYECSTCH